MGRLLEKCASKSRRALNLGGPRELEHLGIARLALQSQLQPLRGRLHVRQPLPIIMLCLSVYNLIVVPLTVHRDPARARETDHLRKITGLLRREINLREQSKVSGDEGCRFLKVLSDSMKSSM